MKIKTLILELALLLSTASGFAQGGTDGEITWKVENGTLTISGEGVMPDYGSIMLYSYFYVTTAPWGKYFQSITMVVIEKGVTGIGKNAFLGLSSVISIIIPNTVTIIKEWAFSDCYSLLSTILPESITSIERSAFFACESLTSITLPNNIISIGELVFWNCANLRLITNLNPIPVAINPNVFDRVDQKKCTLEVLINSVSAYEKADVWKEFNIVGIEVEVEEIPITNYELRVFPNPATGSCSIGMPDEFLYERLTLSVYDASGKLVNQTVFDNNADTPQLKMGLESKGMYVVVLSNGKKEYRGKVVFQ